MSGPIWTLEDDDRTVVLTFPTEPPVRLRLDAAGAGRAESREANAANAVRFWIASFL